MMPRLLLIVTTHLLLAGVAPAFAQSRAVNEQRVAVIKGDLECEHFALTPDLKHVAFITDVGNASVAAERAETERWLGRVVKQKPLDPRTHRGLAAALVKDKRVVVVDGVEIGPFEVVVPPILFSSDGQHITFCVRETSKTYAERAVVDGKQFSDCREVSGLKFSSDGSQFAYRATDHDPVTKKIRYCAVLDGKEQGWCDQMADFGESLYFSPDGKRFAWVGCRADKSGNQEDYICVDGKEAGPFVNQGCPGWAVYFSPDGRHVAYFFQRSASDSQGKNRFTTYLMLDGSEQVVNGSVGSGRILFSPDGNRLAYVAGGKLTAMELESGKKQEWDCESETRVRFSPDSRHVAFVEKTYNGSRVVVDGVAGPVYFGIGSAPIFSPNSRHMAYVAEIENRTNRTLQCFAVVDAVQQKPPLKRTYQNTDIAFSADGEHFAYLSESKGRACVVVDGMPGPAFAGTAIANSLIISSNGTRTAWLLNTSTRAAQVPGDHAVILDGRMQTPYRSIEPRSLRFSPDGRHCAYVVIASKEFGEFAVVDGIKSKTYRALLPSRDDYSNAVRTNLIVFDGNNLIRYAAQTKTEILIVEEKLP